VAAPATAPPPRRPARVAAASGEVSQSGKKPKRGRAAKEAPDKDGKAKGGKDKDGAKSGASSASASLSSMFWAEDAEDEEEGESFLVRPGGRVKGGASPPPPCQRGPAAATAAAPHGGCHALLALGLR
jgi:hypothetical protein